MQITKKKPITSINKGNWPQNVELACIFYIILFFSVGMIQSNFPPFTWGGVKYPYQRCDNM